MLKILPLIISAVILSACSASVEKTASSSYVKASGKVSDAAKAFNNADYQKALELCNQAKVQVEKIIEAYPESTIALKIVTDPTTRIGACAYTDLSSKIIPQLHLYSNPKMDCVALAWAVAIANKNTADKDAALFALVRKIVDTKKSLSELSEEESKARIFAIANISSATIKSATLAYRSKKQNSENSISNKTVNESTTQKIDISKIDIAQFLTSSKTDASLVSYDISVIKNLRSKAPIALAIGGKTKEMFAGYINLATENARKISVKNVRDTALAQASLLSADFQDIANAVKVMEEVSNPMPYLEYFNHLAIAASKSKDFKLAIPLTSKLPSKEKDSFLATLSTGLVQQGYFTDAALIADNITDIASKNSALADILMLATKNNDAKGVVDAVSKFNTSSLEFLDKIFVLSVKNQTLKRSFQLVSLANILEKFDNAKALVFVEMAKDFSLKIDSSDTKSFSKISGDIALSMARNGKPELAIQYLNTNIYRSDMLSSFRNICSVIPYLKDNDQKLKAFAVAANLCNSISDTKDPTIKAVCAVELAYSVSQSGLNRQTSVLILTPFLPVF